MSDTTEYKRAPAGFTDEQWETFERDGILIFENALSEDEVNRYVRAIERAKASDTRCEEDGSRC